MQKTIEVSTAAIDTFHTKPSSKDMC
jgi:hypothetical protein